LSEPFDRDRLFTYQTLMRDVVSDRLSAAEFQSRYLKLFKDDPTLWNGEMYSILEEAFEYTEGYEQHEDVRRGANLLDEHQIKAVIARLLPRIDKLLE